MSTFFLGAPLWGKRRMGLMPFTEKAQTTSASKRLGGQDESLVSSSKNDWLAEDNEQYASNMVTGSDNGLSSEATNVSRPNDTYLSATSSLLEKDESSMSANIKPESYCKTNLLILLYRMKS